MNFLTLSVSKIGVNELARIAVHALTTSEVAVTIEMRAKLQVFDFLSILRRVFEARGGDDV